MDKFTEGLGIFWRNRIRDFAFYLKLEKSVSKNTVQAYLSDIRYLALFYPEKNPLELSTDNIDAFILHIHKNGLSDKSSEGISIYSQARLVSSIKSFYKFLLFDEQTDDNPAKLLQAPSIGRKLPDVLSSEEIDNIISSIDLSRPDGHRNRAIIEFLYGCGLRVSELTNLRMSALYFEDGFISVTGKGNKQRLVPVNENIKNHTNYYLQHSRNGRKIKQGFEDYLFLSRLGKSLSRVSIFNIVKQAVQNAGISKNVSPHTFRHSFASHLIEGGADLRAVQDMLGHESVLTTEIYTHLDKRFLHETIEKYHPLSSTKW